jgi:hypothetical protein
VLTPTKVGPRARPSIKGSCEACRRSWSRLAALVLADQSKIGVVCDVTICALDRVNVVIMGHGFSEEVRAEVRQLGLRVVVV